MPAGRHRKPRGNCLGPCGKPLRSSRDRKADYPDTVAEYTEGLCQTCTRHYREEGKPFPKPVHEPVDVWRRDLEAYLRARRQRIALSERKEHVVGIDPSTCGACTVALHRPDSDGWSDWGADEPEAQRQDGRTEGNEAA